MNDSDFGLLVCQRGIQTDPNGTRMVNFREEMSKLWSSKVLQLKWPRQRDRTRRERRTETGGLRVISQDRAWVRPCLGKGKDERGNGLWVRVILNENGPGQQF